MPHITIHVSSMQGSSACASSALLPLCPAYPVYTQDHFPLPFTQLVLRAPLPTMPSRSALHRAKGRRDQWEALHKPLGKIAVEKAVRLGERYKQESTVLRPLPPVLSRQRQPTSFASSSAWAPTTTSTSKQTPSSLSASPRSSSAVVRKACGGRRSRSDPSWASRPSTTTPPRLAGLLDWLEATFASKLEILGKVVKGEEQVQVTREVDGGLIVLKAKLSMVATTDLRLSPERPSVRELSEHSNLKSITGLRRKRGSFAEEHVLREPLH